MKRFTRAILFLALAASLVLVVSCTKAKPLGSEENPIVWAFVPSGDTDRVTTGANQVADLLQAKTGLHFKTLIATEYAGVIEALEAKPPKAQMSSLATFAYVLAAERGVAQSALVAVRYGSPTYAGQIMVAADSGITELSQLKGKSFARADVLSTSSWIIPMLELRAAGIDTDGDLTVVDAGSHDAVVMAIYNGNVVAGASFVDARTNVVGQHPDVNDKVKVIATTTQIPNDGVQFSPSMDAELKAKIVKALMEISADEEGKKALKTAYNWNELTERDDSFYDPFRQVLQAAGIKVEDLMK